MATYAEKAIRVTVEGRVQGVGFRYSTRRVAQESNVSGWARNLRSGAVEVWAQGSPTAVDDFLRFLQQGPRGAVVSSIDLVEVEADPALSGFEIRF